MENLIYGEFRDRIKRFEGWRKCVYWDGVGNLTGAWGHNFTANWMPQEYIDRWGVKSIARPIIKEQGEFLLTYDIKNSIKELAKIFGFDKEMKWPQGVQYALTDMMFNMGHTRFRTFKKMIEAIYMENWRDMILELHNSLYYQQIDNIVRHLKASGKSGVFHRAEMNKDAVLKYVSF